MNENAEIIELLKDIKNAIESGQENQKKLISLYVEQVELSKKRVDESIGLQKVAVQRQQSILKIAYPLLVFLIGMILYIFFKYL